MTGRSGSGPSTGAPDAPVAVVTGGGTGLGFAIARRLSAEGYAVVLASRSAAHLEPAVERLRAQGRTALAVPTDVRQPEQVDALFSAVGSRFGRLDVLVNNAAGNFVAPAEALSPNGWRSVVATVLDGSFYCARAAFPRLCASPRAAIVNVVASYAWGAGPGTVHSAAAKAGVVALTRTLAVEWAPHGIRVNAVSPGPVHTEGTDQQLWTSPEVVDSVTRTVPLARFGRPEEIAAGVAYLVGPDAAYVTGQVLTIDGGQSLGMGLMRLAPTPRPAGGRRSS